MQPRSLLLQWHITERCDHSCSHCYQDGSVVDLPYDSLLEILEQFRSLVRTLRSVSRQRIPAHITVTGGEPFLRDDFFDLLEQLHRLRREFSFAVLTSGSRIDRVCADRLKGLGPGFVQVSLEGRQETHDAIRGRGDFERVLTAVRHLKKAGVPVLISFTAHRGNFREFADVAAIGRRLGVRRVWADRFVPLGGVAAQRDMVLSPQETDEFLEIMGSARSRRSLLPCPTEVSGHRALQFRAAGGRPYRCQAGRELITVMADGGLVPCRRMPLPLGNLLQQGLSEILAASPLLEELRSEDTPAGCTLLLLPQGMLRRAALPVTGPERFIPACRPRLFDATTSPMLHLKKLSKDFAGNPLFTEISWHLKKGERVALVGENGAGKSTLMQIIAGQVEPSSGEIQFARGARAAYLPQDGIVTTKAACCSTRPLSALGELQAMEEELHVPGQQLELLPHDSPT